MPPLRSAPPQGPPPPSHALTQTCASLAWRPLCLTFDAESPFFNRGTGGGWRLTAYPPVFCTPGPTGGRELSLPPAPPRAGGAGPLEARRPEVRGAPMSANIFLNKTSRALKLMQEQ